MRKLKQLDLPMKKQVCVGGILIQDDQLLLGKRSKNKDWAPGVWDIVGGKSLKNEHPLLTLRREVFEEIQVDVLNADLIQTLDVSGPGGNFTYHIFIITAFKGKPKNCSNEHTKIKWFKWEKLEKLSLAAPEYLDIFHKLLPKEDVK
jgi:mutator protein MutT